MLATRAAVDDADAANKPIGLGDIEEVEVLVRICGCLKPKDLGRLACVSGSFGRTIGWQCSVVDGGATEQRSVVEETARRWVSACPVEDQVTVVQWPGWLRRMQELQRLSVVFSCTAPAPTIDEYESYYDDSRGVLCLRLSQRGTVATCYSHGTAASAIAMRAGRHYAAFTTPPGMCQAWHIGLIRPGFDVGWIDLDHEDRYSHPRGHNGFGFPSGYPNLSRLETVDGLCFYNTLNGQCDPSGTDWEGMQTASEGDIIGLLLDLDAGNLTVFKNGDRLGVMATRLSGEYCWAVSLVALNWEKWDGWDRDGGAVPAGVRIEAAPVRTAAEIVAVDSEARFANRCVALETATLDALHAWFRYEETVGKRMQDLEAQAAGYVNAHAQEVARAARAAWEAGRAEAWEAEAGHNVARRQARRGGRQRAAAHKPGGFRRLSCMNQKNFIMQ
jgi:hypothetical protein